jgi:hypothetical protein
MRKLNRPHLIAGQQAFTYSPQFRVLLDKAFAGTMVEIANVHPLPDTVFGGRTYQLGDFMSKELKLSEVADFCRAAYNGRHPMVLDEDNTASIYRDPVGWTIHRKRAWTALLNGAHYDYIDFSITVGSEAGTPASRREIRSWMQYLSEFMSGFDFVHSKPANEWISTTPKNLVASALAIGGRDYAAYLADSREVTDPSAGQPIAGRIELVLPAGKFSVRLYSPVAGRYSPGVIIEGGRTVELDLGTFQNDLVIRATQLDH